MTRAYAEPDALPTRIRRMLRAQCDGEWERVTVDDDGAFLVHNNAAQARRFLGLSPSQYADVITLPRREQPKKAPKRKPPAPRRQVLEPPPEPLPSSDPSLELKMQDVPVAGVKYEDRRPVHRQPAPRRAEPDPEVRALAHLLAERVPAVDSQGVTVYTVPEEAKLQRAELYKMIWSDTRGDPDWDSIDVDATAYQLQQRLQHGLPQWLPFQFHPEVLSLWGMDEGLMTDALRFPERVEIRPETRSKKYPVLAFYRGDLNVILGMRMPHSPAVIAAYAGSRLQGGGNGQGSINAGGGSKRQGGLPGTPRASVRKLRGMGAEVEMALSAETVEVKYQGQVLGRITVAEHTSKPQVQSDYQRMQRKINAIDSRVPATR